MQVMLLPSSVSADGNGQNQFLTSFLFNETVAIDAGSLGLYRSTHEQARIRHVLLTHSHLDHIASLPIFLENAYERRRDCVTVHGGAVVLDCLRRDVFNDRVWPDFLRLSTPDAPFLQLARLEAGKPVELEGLRFTPVPVDHVVPTFGFVVEGAAAAVVLSGDTGPTDELWQYANRTPHLKAVFLEVTFPDELAELADLSKHLTPATFAQEAAKLTQPARVLAIHIKARYRARVVHELRALGLPNVEIGEAGRVYEF